LVRKSNSEQIRYLNIIKERQDEVGPGFCVLKWYHLEMHLGTGLSHSCFHCPTQQIPLDSDLHNTPQKIEQRELMLKGERPDECSYCWDIEDLGNVSARQTLAAQYFQHDNKIDLKAAKAGTSYVYPKYLELSFTNKCQMACSYCGPVFSTSWEKEIRQHGPYKLTKKGYNLIESPQIENSPFVKKFWKWFPKAYEHLFVLRVTGGEPLLDKNTYRLLQYVKDNPKEGLTFHCNTNLMVTANRVHKYINLVKDIPDTKLYVSIDSWGDQAEYIRHGLDMDRFEENLHKVLANGIPVGIMCTFCFLSIPNFEQFLFKVAELKNTYGDLITLDMPNMVDPLHLTARIADDHVISILDNSLDFMKSFDHVFEPYEIIKLERTTEWIKANRFDGKELKIQRNDFVKFVDEHDKRRGTNFTKTFPELGEFYGRIKASN